MQKIYIDVSDTIPKVFVLSNYWMKWRESHSVIWLCDPLYCRPSDTSVHGISHARTLEWVAIYFSRASSQPRDWTYISHIAGRFFTIWDAGYHFHDEVFRLSTPLNTQQDPQKHLQACLSLVLLVNSLLSLKTDTFMMVWTMVCKLLDIEFQPPPVPSPFLKYIYSTFNI